MTEPQELPPVVVPVADPAHCVCGHTVDDHEEDDEGPYCLRCECEAYRQRVH